MKVLVATGFCAAMALSITAYGQTSSSMTTMNLVGNCLALNGGGNACSPGASSSCDVVDKTPNEVNECKLKYWKFKLEMLQKEQADLSKKVDEAKERVQAFSSTKH